MIRRVRRFWRMRNEARIAPRLKEVLYQLYDAVPELEGAKPVRSGHRGHDSNYYLERKGQKLAVMRLNNPYINRLPPAPDMPFVLAAPEKRIAHELAAYMLGGSIHLTPQPLWHTKDALVCRYVPHKSLTNWNHPRFWDLLQRVNRAIATLHGIGLTHMDMSFNNILLEPERQYFTFIDFEYQPAPGLSIASQRAYDYLRLLESQWKFVPSNIRGEYGPWLAEVAEHLGPEIRQVDMARLAPALGRILTAHGLGEAIKKRFS